MPKERISGMEIWAFLTWLFSPEPALWVTALGLGVGFTMALAPQLRNIRLAHLFFGIAWLWAFLCVTEELAVSKMSSHFALPIVFIAGGAIAVLAVLTYRWVESNHRETKQSSPAVVNAVTPASIHPQPKPLVEPAAPTPTPHKKQAIPKKPIVPNPLLPAPQSPLSGTPPPIQDIRIVSQDWISSTNPKFKYELKVIVQTNVVVEPVSFIFVCNAELGYGTWEMPGGPGFSMVDWSQVLGNKSAYRMAFRSPAWSPENNIVVYLFSNSPIRVTSFERAPFPTDKDVRRQ
jgi:hypothetical protein